ncbi:energy transducer TonB [Aquimarina longa]|uniref:energy transducer TonB n=1 Tax=Aquimarina longa TaxID=1080221 RepID=UPI000782B551|nr:energy transducer TonB [Aquimarina longa]
MKKTIFLHLIIALLFSCSAVKTQNVKGETKIKSFPLGQSLWNEEDVDIPFAIIDNPPIFKNCKSEKKNNINECFEQQFNNFIKNNLKYPKIAKKNKIQGRVLIKYIINKNGSVSNVSAKGNEYLLDESIRLIKLLPIIAPAKQRNRPISFEGNKVINFELD